MEFSSLNIDIIGESDSEQRIYDDPCDLMDDVPIFHLPISRSWFCCPTDKFCIPTSSNPGQTNNAFYNNYPDYSLVTEAPTTQNQTVCFLVLKMKFSSS